MKPLLVLLATALLGVSACGSAKKSTTSTSRTASRVASSRGASAPTSSNIAPTSRHLKGDEDDDDVGGELNKPGPVDSDNDTDNDYRDNASKGYYDSDDGAVPTYGHPASAADTQALTALAKRYFAAATAGEAAKACSMITSVLVKAIPEDYGRAPGPVYLRGSTCQAVMTHLFKHVRAQLAASTVVTGVRVNGSQAHVLLGSTTMPASYLFVERERGAWKIAGLLGVPLP